MARKKSTAMAVGHYSCPNPIHKKTTLAVIRMKTNGTLFGYCGEGCGMTDWNLPRGQKFFNEFGTFWPCAAGTSGDKFAPRIPPENLPEWIRKNLAWAPTEKQGREDDEDPPADPQLPPPGPGAEDPPMPAPPPKPDPKPDPKPKPAKKKRDVIFPWDEDDE